jgi:NadR type nicotinamide-nucleotide adenylyltransferase
MTPPRVVLIGPESTGKTRLAERLAARYGVPCSSEYAREHVEREARALSENDVEPIARGQRAGEDAALRQAVAQGSRFVLNDTDLVSTQVYACHYYGRCPSWIEAEAAQRLGGLYLLHHVDVPWIAEGHQREQPARRGELFTLFERTLTNLGAVKADIFGDWNARERRALEAIERLLHGHGAGTRR